MQQAWDAFADMNVPSIVFAIEWHLHCCKNELCKLLLQA